MVTTLNFILKQLEPLKDFWPKYHNQICTLESLFGYSVKNRLKGASQKQRDQLVHIVINPKQKNILTIKYI